MHGVLTGTLSLPKKASIFLYIDVLGTLSLSKKASSFCTLMCWGTYPVVFGFCSLAKCLL